MDIFIFFIIGFIIVAINIALRRRYSSFDDYTVDIGWSSNKKGQKRVSEKDKISHRKLALAHAGMYLKPYKELMGEHCLANENCKVNLIIEDSGEKKIICINKHITDDNKRKILTAKISTEYVNYYSQTPDYVIDFLWDTLCTNFTVTTMYENVYEAVHAGILDVKEAEIEAQQQDNKTTQKTYDKVSNINIRSNNLLNINSATEAELLALPGVNIVLAKKIKKYIEKHGAFSSVDEFIEKFGIKDIFADQIRGIICTSIEDNEPPKEQNKPNTETTTDNDDITDFIPHSDNERIIDL